MIYLAIADDERLFRRGLIELLDDGNSIRFCLEAGNGLELLTQLEQAGRLPDVLLLDISMPVMNGLQTFDIIREKYPQIKILVLSIHYTDSYIITLIEKGANGYLSKNTDPDEVRKAIITVAKTGFYFNDDTIRAMHKNIAGKHRGIIMGDEITEREKEVLELICHELTTGEIAERLFISKRTAEGHRNSLLLKTGAKNTAGLVIYAIRHQVYSVEKF
ncbi:response regulator transcription factor [Longitalea arenae]|uniref:response regulator transcription factor n=1 Tax=Longitalea arenae TaxID=2812558 RepID=UPI0019687A8D|nr:response regulator transcription factor [Longitalea arenae]